MDYSLFKKLVKQVIQECITTIKTRLGLIYQLYCRMIQTLWFLKQSCYVIYLLVHSQQAALKGQEEAAVILTEALQFPLTALKTPAQ